MSRPDTSVRGQKGRGVTGHSRGYRGQTVEWYTPPGLFRALDLEFDLDPCSPPGGLDWVPAKRVISPPRDGLVEPWEGRVWLNPPYGPSTVAWLRRLAAHGDGIALVFARTETRWWHETVGSASAVTFIAGRLTFVDGDRKPSTYNSGSPSALVAYGEECARAIERAALGMTFAVRSTSLLGQASLLEVGIE